MPPSFPPLPPSLPQVLKYEMSRRPSLAGVGVLGLDAVHRPLLRFVEQVRGRTGGREGRKEGRGGEREGRCGCACHHGSREEEGEDDGWRETNGDAPPLYFVSVDVERCYDHIQVHRLMDILRGREEGRGEKRRGEGGREGGREGGTDGGAFLAHFHFLAHTKLDARPEPGFLLPLLIPFLPPSLPPSRPPASQTP